MRTAITKLRAVAVVFSFSVVLDLTHGGVYGPILFPECSNAGSILLPNTPCYGVQASQVYNLLTNKLQALQPNVQQAGFYEQQPQMLDNMERLRLQQFSNTVDQYRQYSPVQNFNVIPRYQGKSEEHGRFRRQIPYQLPFGATQYGNYNPYQDGNVMQPLAGLYPQGLGIQPNSFQQAGFNQFAALQNGFQQTVNPQQYNAYGDSSNWLPGYGVQPGLSFPSISVSGGFQMTGQNVYGNSYPSSLGQCNQISFMGTSNYPVSTCFYPYVYVNGFLPLCQMPCQQPDPTPAPQQSQWMNYEQLKARLAQIANLQLTSSSRSLEKPHVITQAPLSNALPAVASATVASVARKFESESTPKQESLPVVAPTQEEAPISHPSSQAVLPVESPTTPMTRTTAASSSNTQPPEPATPSPVQPSEPPTSAPEPPASSPEPPVTSETPPTQAVPIPASPSSLTYASTTKKPIKASRSILDD